MNLYYNRTVPRFLTLLPTYLIILHNTETFANCNVVSTYLKCKRGAIFFTLVKIEFHSNIVKSKHFFAIFFAVFFLKNAFERFVTSKLRLTFSMQMAFSRAHDTAWLFIWHANCKIPQKNYKVQSKGCVMFN